jgi:hypothetical protein
MGRFDILNEIQRLDPERDNQRIMHLSFGYEFPWDSVRALEVALYRTYCIPSISKLLDRTGECYIQARTTPHFFTDNPNRTHVHGYDIAKLGPPRLVAKERKP